MPRTNRQRDSDDRSRTGLRTLRILPPALALTVVGAITVVQLAPPAAVASQHAQQTPIERLNTLVTSGYETDTLLAAGFTTAQINTFYTAAMTESDAIDAFAAKTIAAHHATKQLKDATAAVRQFGLDDDLEAARVLAEANLATAESELVDAEEDLATAIADELDGDVSATVLTNLRTLVGNRDRALPTAWRLAVLNSDDEIKLAERLAAKVGADPNAPLSSEQASLLAAITGNADVSAAAFRVESGSNAARVTLMQYMVQLKDGQ